MRVALIALLCALAGGLAALGLGRAGGWFGGRTTTETVIVRRSAPAASSTAPSIPATGAQAFDPAGIFRRRSPGVVTVFAYFGGTGAQGSGFVVSPTGTILTNAHVITNAGETSGAVSAASAVYVEFPDHDRVPATVVGWDVFDDVGVLRIDPAAHALEPLPLGRSAGVTVGEPVAAIGSPLGNADSLATGVVSAVHRSIAALTANFDLPDAIQIDAPIGHGSSGGPLLDAAGRVIGINAQIRTDQGAPSGIGFAVPIDAARRSLRALLTKGKVEYAYLGVQAEDLTPALAAHLHLQVTAGALVDQVTPGGPADKAGIRGGSKQETFLGEAVVAGGDVVVAVDGHRVTGADSFVRIVTNDLSPGRAARIAVVRDGRRRTIVLTPTPRPGR